jgi:hypothetical protein
MRQHHQASSTPPPPDAPAPRVVRIVFDRPFIETAAGAARVINLRAPTSPDELGRYFSVARLQTRSFPVTVLDSLIERPDLALLELETDAGRRFHPLSSYVWSRIVESNGPAALIRVIAGFCEAISAD